MAERHEVDAWTSSRSSGTPCGRPGPIGDGLGDALALWRGVPYEDLDGEAVLGTRVRLEELARVAVDRWAELLLDAGLRSPRPSGCWSWPRWTTRSASGGGPC